MKFDWKNYDEKKPNSSGLYFVMDNHDVEVMYYCKQIDIFIYFEYDYVGFYPLRPRSGLLWAKMPRFSKSKLLNDGYIRIEV